jgi:hypothetical protein
MARQKKRSGKRKPRTKSKKSTGPVVKPLGRMRMRFSPDAEWSPWVYSSMLRVRSPRKERLELANDEIIFAHRWRVLRGNTASKRLAAESRAEFDAYLVSVGRG